MLATSCAWNQRRGICPLRQIFPVLFAERSLGEDAGWMSPTSIQLQAWQMLQPTEEMGTQYTYPDTHTLSSVAPFARRMAIELSFLGVGLFQSLHPWLNFD
jgi:hypothetical protein